MSDILRGDDTSDAFKKAMEKGTEVQKDFVRQFSAIQQDTMQNLFKLAAEFLSQKLRDKR